ncbi:MAG TPA: hypothetical protein VEH50_14010, partial [Methylomirabilota bacterium]|nr:hypothetical protein [Methylomirabilota bacterium]
HPGHQIFIYTARQNPFADGNAKVARRVAAIGITRCRQPHRPAQAPTCSEYHYVLLTIIIIVPMNRPAFSV